VRLRFTGAAPVSFQAAGLGEVEPGDEFHVPDERAEGWLRRPDIEPADPPGEADDPPPARSRAKSKAATGAAFSMPAADQQPEK
jgi:hypothetical protein